jgi:uncharacterized protein (TIGR02246 family)
MTSLSAGGANIADEDAVRDVAHRYCDAWNKHDMTALAELFDADAQWINIVGMHWRGKAAAVAGHEAYHRTFFRATEVEMADVRITGIAPGVAAAVLLLKVGPFTPPDGIARPESQDRLSLIVAKRSGRWLIAHGHNTVIDPGAQRFDPVRAGWPDAGSG